jgi:hypothetical protein
MVERSTGTSVGVGVGSGIALAVGTGVGTAVGRGVSGSTGDAGLATVDGNGSAVGALVGSAVTFCADPVIVPARLRVWESPVPSKVSSNAATVTAYSTLSAAIPVSSVAVAALLATLVAVRFA